MRTKIIYEDEQVLVCHKPAGLATQSGRVGQADMISELKKYLATGERINRTQDSKRQLKSMTHSGEPISVLRDSAGKGDKSAQTPYLGIIHRLDQPVEGLLVFGKTRDAAANLTAQLTKGSLNKQYYAMVCGKPTDQKGELVDYLVKDKDMARVSEKGETEKEAKQAILQYKLISTIVTNVSDEGQDISLLDIHIDTGRFHQIRVQMSHAGLPLLGDSKYGSEFSQQFSKMLGICNVSLWAYHIEFVHPKTGKKLAFEVEPDLPCGFGKIS